MTVVLSNCCFSSFYVVHITSAAPVPSHEGNGLAWLHIFDIRLECLPLPRLLLLLLLSQAGDASGTGLLDTAQKTWDTAVMDLIDPQLKSWMPPLIRPNEVSAFCSPPEA